MLLENLDTKNKLECTKGLPLRGGAVCFWHASSPSWLGITGCLLPLPFAGEFLKWMWYAESFLAELQKSM